MSDDFEPVIVMASIVPGHDGLAEVAIVVQYPNGAQRPMALPMRRSARLSMSPGLPASTS